MRQIFFQVAYVAENFSRFWSSPSNDSSSQPPSNVIVCLNEMPHRSSIQSVMHLTSTNRFVVGYHNGSVRCYANEAPFDVLEDFNAAAPEHPIFCLAAYGRYLVTGAGNGEIAFWNFEKETSIRSDLKRPTTLVSVLQFTHEIGPICFLKVRGDLLIASNYLGHVAVWRITENEIEREEANISIPSQTSLEAHSVFRGNVNHWEMDVDVDRQHVASASSDGLRLWSLEDGRMLHHVVDEEDFDTAVAFLDDEDFIVIGTDSGVLKLMRKSTGRICGKFRCCGNDDDDVFAEPAVIKLRYLERSLIVASYEQIHRMWDVDEVIRECCRVEAAPGVNGLGIIRIPTVSELCLEANRIDFSLDKMVYSTIGGDEAKLCVVQRREESTNRCAL